MKQIIIHSIKNLDKHINQLKKIKVWVCNTACGKSYLAKNDDRFFDLDHSRSTFMKEGYKNFDEMTIPLMYDLLNQGKIILNAAHGHFLDYLDKHNIPFVYMYGKPEVEAEYIERMRQRGNDEEFINNFGKSIASYYSTRANDKRGTFKIEMSCGEYVSDYILKVFGSTKN